MCVHQQLCAQPGMCVRTAVLASLLRPRARLPSLALAARPACTPLPRAALHRALVSLQPQHSHPRPTAWAMRASCPRRMITALAPLRVGQHVARERCALALAPTAAATLRAEGVTHPLPGHAPPPPALLLRCALSSRTAALAPRPTTRGAASSQRSHRLLLGHRACLRRRRGRLLGGRRRRGPARSREASIRGRRRLLLRLRRRLLRLLRRLGRGSTTPCRRGREASAGASLRRRVRWR